MKKYYLAYGSNLNLNQMKTICPTSKLIGKTILNDYRLVFKGRGKGFLTVEESLNSLVPIGVFEITELDEHNLDWYEGYPTLYTKKTISVIFNGQKIEGLIYIMNPNYTYSLPNMKYITTCTEGYNNFGFNRAILSEAFEYSLNNLEKKLIK